jgi:hypothetical protein
MRKLEPRYQSLVEWVDWRETIADKADAPP